MYKEITKELLDFLKKSPTAFHAVSNICDELEKAEFHELKEESKWQIEPGGKYYVTRNGSSVIAFHIGTDLSEYGFNIAASHSDSPTFKVKENAELEIRGKYTQLNTEGYGGMICSTWFDRPLSVAGRVLVKEGNKFHVRLVDMERDLVLIPSMAIHMNRKINEGYAINKQVDTLPLFGGQDTHKGDLKKMIAGKLGVAEENIYGNDLYLYNRMEPSIWGEKEEFISAPHLDDLQCAYTSLQGFLEGGHPQTVNVYACFDNEEVGSASKQGADSTFLYDVLHRINAGLGKTEEDYYRAVASSFMLSADNAHAVHPNHPEKTDVENCAYMNEGVVVKSHAGQKYTSDGVSIGIFREICERAGVPVQFFANRSDEAGGSTLGNLSSAHVSLKAVDIGLPQLAMHSAYETAGIKDTLYMERVMEVFYRSRFKGEDEIEIGEC
ncbi:M18 family aminopeptidase [Roseburia hominis]